MKDLTEQILVIKKDLITNLFQGFEHITKHPHLYEQISNNNSYKSRWQDDSDYVHMEKNYDYKQLIPYTIIIENDQVFMYERLKKSGEARLQNLYSIGIGGHVNPCQHPDAIKEATVREINEELIIKGNIEPKLIGYINLDHNDVGKVHLGLIYILKLEQGQYSGVRETDKIKGQFVPVNLIIKNKDKMETWSQALIDHPLNLLL